MVAAKPLLIISRHAPGNGPGPLAALHAALTAASFNIPVRLLLLDHGVRQLFSGSTATETDFRRQLMQIELFDTIELLFDAAAAKRLAEGVPRLPATALDAPALSALCRQAQTVLCY